MPNQSGFIARATRVTRSRTGSMVLRALALLCVGVCALFGVQREQWANNWFDVLDEAAHFDYVLKLSEGGIPSWGSLYEQETLLIADCLGSPLVPSALDCEVKDRTPSMFAPNGYNYEAQQPPLGYVAYLPGLWMSDGMEPSQQLNFVRDLGGTVLLGFALLLLLLVSAQLRLGFWRTALLAAVILLAPTTVHAFSTVSNDASTVVVVLAFAAFLLAARKRSPRAALVLGVVAGVILGATKAYTVLLPLGGLAAILLLDVLLKDRTVAAVRGLLRRADVRFLLASAGASLLVALGFTLAQSLRGSVSSGVVLSSLMGFSMSDSVNPNTVVSSVANLSNQWLGAGNGLVHSAQFFVAVNGLMMILVGVAFVRGKGANATNARFFATTWAIVILAFSIAWPILLHFQGHFDFDTPARYGLLLLPLSALAITEGVVRARVQSPDMAENVTPRA